MKVWMCMNCGWMYNEAKGDPAGEIAPGTRWEDIPDTWVCPDCSSKKSDFDMVEV